MGLKYCNLLYEASCAAAPVENADAFCNERLMMATTAASRPIFVILMLLLCCLTTRASLSPTTLPSKCVMGRGGDDDDVLFALGGSWFVGAKSSVSRG